MKPQTKIYIGLSVTAMFTIGIVGGHLWSNHKIAMLENAVEKAKQQAISSQRSAEKNELEAAAYKRKIDYLEQRLTEIQIIARKQDEKLEKQTTNTRNARADVERVRGTRSIAATASELCKKLAELGHGCEP
ncbi:MAG: hypothetical protein ACKVQJ_09605 [Pyrinomonadaceae bacterium]